MTTTIALGMLTTAALCAGVLVLVDKCRGEINGSR